MRIACADSVLANSEDCYLVMRQTEVEHRLLNVEGRLGKRMEFRIVVSVKE